jgi:hypothetical protein
MIMGDRHWALHNILSSFHKNIYSEFSDPVDTDKTDEIIAPTMHPVHTNSSSVSVPKVSVP